MVLQRRHVTRQAKWLIQAPFWLLAAKFSATRKSTPSRTSILADFPATFGKLARHLPVQAVATNTVAVAKYQEASLSPKLHYESTAFIRWN
jgi:hypothetical protein